MRPFAWSLMMFLVGNSLGLSAQTSTDQRKVVLVTVTGASDLLLEDFLARGVLPPDGGFSRLFRTGAWAEHLVPVAAPETPISFASLQTGAYPERHGMVGFFFHESGTPISEYTSTFDFSYQAETLVEAALRQGKNVVQLFSWPPREEKPGSGTLYSLPPPQPVSRSAIVEFAGEPNIMPSASTGLFERIRPVKATDDSPAPAAVRFFEGNTVNLFLYAVDSMRDGLARYDTLLLDLDETLDNGWLAEARQGEWATVPVSSGDGAVALAVRVVELAGETGSGTVFLTGAVPMTGQPAEFADKIRAHLGWVPPGTDRRMMSLGLPGEHLWWEQKGLATRFIRDVALYTLRDIEFDLLILPLSLDGVGHFFHLRNPRQPAYDDEEGEKRQRFARYVERGYQETDRYLRELMESAPEGTNFVVVSDHGMVSQHTVVQLHALLAGAGFQITDDNESELIAHTTGNSADVYLNLEGREPGGIVPQQDRENFIERIVQACKSLVDAETGEPIFEKVLTRPELAELRMAHPQNSGDVWVVARPGYTIGTQIDSRLAVLAPYEGFSGLHGHLATNREMQGVFLAVGPEVPRGLLGPVRTVDIAPTVSALLGIDPPAQSQGENVLARTPE